MLQYTVRTKKKGGDIPSTYQKNTLKHLFIILIFIALIVGWFYSGKMYMDKWLDETTNPYCNDRFQFPLYTSLLFAYAGFILWFAQFPTRGSETIQNIFSF